MKTNQTAFSLVELSIVLVILGLLTGGILGGQSLIRAAELRAVSTEASRYVTATQTFRDKYFALPGDFTDATRFWGRMNGNADCVTNSSAAVNSAGACDGNGNGSLNSPAAANQAGEYVGYWRHLANAGLIEGTYSGLAGSGGQFHCVLGTDCPRSRVNNAGWYSANATNYAGSPQIYAMDYGNYLLFGGQQASAAPTGLVLKPEEMWNIDTKMDDGRPGYGKLIAYNWNGCATGGASNSDLANSVYNLSDSTLRCAFYYRQAF
jgi:prepilin-type N-terminal cleavage/methylation domain-containing protein